MFYRHKILLAILETWGGEISAIDFQKILFLFTKEQKTPTYYFVPYNLGCFSFQSYADKRTLIAQGLLEQHPKKWIKKNTENFLSLLNTEDQEKIQSLHQSIGYLRGKNLIKYIYLNHPYFAINSDILDKILTKQEQKIIENQKPKQNDHRLFTIGYQNRSIDYFLNLLVKNNIHALCDVRKNAFSMKYGFSKQTLKTALEKFGIIYIHLPQLGIDSDKRQGLKNLDDYACLFEEYQQTTLKKQRNIIKILYSIFLRDKRIALTCFESNPQYCHRHKVAEKLLQLPKWHYPIEHI